MMMVLLQNKDRAPKRVDYVATGTVVVWDEKMFGEEVVRVYRATAPNGLTTYRRSEDAEAEPALLGFSMLVDNRLP